MKKPYQWIGGLMLLVFTPGCSERATELGEDAVGSPVMLQAAAGPAYQIRSSGDFGWVEWWDGAPNTVGSFRGYVYATRGGTPSAPETWLYYDVYQCCWTLLERGYGPIPNEDLKGSGGGSLSLSTNTAAAANPGLLRDVGSGGVIAVDWNRTPDRSLVWSGTTQERFLDLLYHFSGTQSYSSARVQGSVVAYGITNTLTGYLGQNHNVTMTIETGSQEP